MFWRKLAGQSTKEGAVKSTEANRLVFAPGAAKLLQVSLERVAEAESIDEMDTILFHAMEGTFADQSRAEEYVGVYSEKLAEDDRDYESCERLLITLLRSLLDQIEAAPPQYQTKQRPRTGKVFVVHGHDLKIRDQVCEILESFSLTPVILAETAGSSQTIIELVEKHGGVDHAVCLLTADDVGGSRSGSLRPRARQNVIWEIGYFFGLLGRNQVSIVADEDVELPSNILGLRPIMLTATTNLKERLKADFNLAGTL